FFFFFFFSSRRRHTRFDCDWSSDVCSSDLFQFGAVGIDWFGLHVGLRGGRASGRVGGGSISPEGSDSRWLFVLELCDLDDGVVQIGRASCRERVGGGGVEW